MELFELLARFLEYLFVWFPRPILVSKYEALVRWKLGNPGQLIRGRLTWWMPLIHNIEQIDLRIDATEFEPKVLWTKDGKEVALGMVIAWKVGDPLVCAENVNGLNDLVTKLGESVLPELVGRFSLDDLKRKAAGGEGKEWAFDQHLVTALTSLFKPYGIEVVQARINFTSDKVRTFKVISGGNDGSRISATFGF